MVCVIKRRKRVGISSLLEYSSVFPECGFLFSILKKQCQVFVTTPKNLLYLKKNIFAITLILFVCAGVYINICVCLYRRAVYGWDPGIKLRLSVSAAGTFTRSKFISIRI